MRSIAYRSVPGNRDGLSSTACGVQDTIMRMRSMFELLFARLKVKTKLLFALIREFSNYTVSLPQSQTALSEQTPPLISF